MRYQDMPKERLISELAIARQKNAELQALEIEMKTAEESLKRRLRYEKMVADISTLAIASEDLNLFQQKCLEILGTTLEVSRTYVFQHRYETNTMDNTFEWFAPGITSQKENLQGVSAKDAPWWMEMMRAGRIINCKDSEELPYEAERNILRSQQIKSALAVPLFIKNAYYGFMGFDECRCHREWPMEDVALLKTVSEILGMVLEREQDRHMLIKSEALLRATIESLPFDLFVIEKDGRYSIMNSACRNRWGAAIGKRPEEVKTDEETLRRWRDNNQRAFSGTTVREEVQYKIKGKMEHFYNIISPIPIGNEVSGIVGMNIDITDLKRMEEELRSSEKRYRDLVENMSEVVYIIDRSGRLSFISPSAFDLAQYSPPDLIGRCVEEFIHKEDLQRFRENLKEALGGKKTAGNEYRIVTKSGDIRWVETYTRPVHAGTETAIQGTLLDVTERKQAEEALRHARNNLERRVRERTSELEMRAAQLARLSSELTLAEQRERGRIAEILHDHLQQLMVGAKISQETLIRSIDKALKPEAEHVLGLINQSIKASRTLTAELAPPILESGDLSASLGWLAQWMCENQGLEVKVQADARTVPDRKDLNVLLFQSVRELLLNVLKHSGVKAASVKMNHDIEELRIVVSDRGAGFHPETVWKDAGSSQKFGLMSIRERLLHLGGRLELKSSPGAGSSISLIVPLEKRAAVKELKESSEEALSKPDSVPAGKLQSDDKVRVMVVDDHSVVRQGICAMLGLQSGIEIVGEAPDGEKAVQLARETVPDVILMDINMPAMNGLDATRIIHSEFPHIRIIGLSMHDDQGAEMIEAGASAFCAKDGDTHVLLCAIRGEPATKTSMREYKGLTSDPERKMEGYVCVHKYGDRQIFANAKKSRIYGRLHGFMSEGVFHSGQSALDATFAFLASLGTPHIDYILDMRFSEPWPHNIFQLWVEKSLENLVKYPQVYAVAVARADSPLWLQISQWGDLFEKHGDRILGTFETPEEAEAFLDRLRDI